MAGGATGAGGDAPAPEGSKRERSFRIEKYDEDFIDDSEIEHYKGHKKVKSKYDGFLVLGVSVVPDDVYADA